MSLQSEPMNEDVELLTFRHPNVLEILFQLILVRRGRETIDQDVGELVPSIDGQGSRL